MGQGAIQRRRPKAPRIRLGATPADIGASAASTQRTNRSTARQDVATDATEHADGQWVSDDKKDLLRRLSIGLLGTVLCVVLGTCLLIGSAFVGERWSSPVEICGTVLCASGVLLIPSAMSGYVMGLRVQDTGHAMPVRWRIGMAAAQAWSILGVARHLTIG